MAQCDGKPNWGEPTFMRGRIGQHLLDTFENRINLSKKLGMRKSHGEWKRRKPARRRPFRGHNSIALAIVNER